MASLCLWDETRLGGMESMTMNSATHPPCDDCNGLDRRLPPGIGSWRCSMLAARGMEECAIVPWTHPTSLTHSPPPPKQVRSCRGISVQGCTDERAHRATREALWDGMPEATPELSPITGLADWPLGLPFSFSCRRCSRFTELSGSQPSVVDFRLPGGRGDSPWSPPCQHRG